MTHLTLKLRFGATSMNNLIEALDSLSQAEQDEAIVVLRDYFSLCNTQSMTRRLASSTFLRSKSM